MIFEWLFCYVPITNSYSIFISVIEIKYKTDLPLKKFLIKLINKYLRRLKLNKFRQRLNLLL